MTTIKRLTYDDPIVESQLRAYADSRGFAQLTISRADAPNVLRTVRIRDEALDELIGVLRAARAEQPEPAQVVLLAATLELPRLGPDVTSLVGIETGNRYVPCGNCWRIDGGDEVLQLGELLDTEGPVRIEDGVAEPASGGTLPASGLTAEEAEPLPPVLLPDPDADPSVCPKSKRVDGPFHSTRWDGDDARTVCVFCGQVRDALSGAG